MTAITFTLVLMVAGALTFRWVSLSKDERAHLAEERVMQVAESRKELGLSAAMTPLATRLARSRDITDMAQSVTMRKMAQAVDASGLFGGSMEAFIAYQLAAVMVGSVMVLLSMIGLFDAILIKAVLVFMGLIVAVYPVYAVSDRAKKARKSTSSELPEFIEILRIALAAGMPMRLALQFSIDRFEGDTVFSRSVRRLLTDLQVAPQGSEEKAYLSAGMSIGTTDAKSFFAALSRSDVKGVPAMEILERQAEIIREARVQERHRRAAKLPSAITLATMLHSVPLVLISVGVFAFSNLGGMLGGGGL